MPLSGRARIAGVMGWPVAHSLSPLLHGYWFERYGIDGIYVPLPVAPADVELAFRALPRLGFRGWNVTLPHKEAAYRLVDDLDATARRMKAVNTVLVDAEGRTEGYNTDGLGFIANLDAMAPGWRTGQGRAVLLGIGGAARAVAHALVADGITALTLVNRTVQKADALASELEAVTGCDLEVVSWEGRAAALAEASLLVNCTSLGMHGQPALDLELEDLRVDAAVADLVYVPLETSLLARARARGNPVVDGLGMLLHQAVPGFTHWGGVRPEVDPGLRSCLLQALGARSG
jgi:shikimate dehydrogenase